MKDVDLLILEHAVRNLETYTLIARLGFKKVAFWGHGRTYTKAVPKKQEALKYALARRAAWFFSYTEGGKAALARNGVRAEKITVLGNSFDTSTLSRQLTGISDEDISRFVRNYDLSGKTALFIGGLDNSKRLPFLIEACDQVAASVEGFRLLICGDGDLMGYVREQALTRPWIKVLGPLFGEDKALALAASQLIAMPGRVGLIAVDSFVAGTPIVTTRWEWHAPEFEYLVEGVNSLITDNDPGSYAAALEDALKSEEDLQFLRQGALASKETYSLDSMVDNFVSGLLAWKRGAE